MSIQSTFQAMKQKKAEQKQNTTVSRTVSNNSKVMTYEFGFDIFSGNDTFYADSDNNGIEQDPKNFPFIFTKATGSLAVSEISKVLDVVSSRESGKYIPLSLTLGSVLNLPESFTITAIGNVLSVSGLDVERTDNIASTIVTLQLGSTGMKAQFVDQAPGEMPS